MNDDEFGKRVATLLNEGIEHVDEQVASRLQLARKAALARVDSQPRLAPARVPAGAAGGIAEGLRGLFAGPRLWLALSAIVVALTGVTWSEWSSYQEAESAADLDLAILADDLPVTAYIDNGFDTWLKRPVELQQ
ncbi:MAG: DUF3619 family protein [Proteobacteria bacterium]|nr:DUF3619 family protein [Burkholderiales bacterium]